MRRVGGIVICFLTVTALLAQASDVALIEDYAGQVRLKFPATGQTVQVDDSYKGKKFPSGTTVETGKNSEVRFLLDDGTKAHLKEQTRATLYDDKSKNTFGINLTEGRIRVKIASDKFRIRTSSGHEIGGKDSILEVTVDKEGRVTVFCIEGEAVVVDPYGGMIRMGEGQSYAMWYDKKRDAYMVQANENNETSGKFVAGGKEHPLLPGSGYGINKKGEVLPLVPPPPPEREIGFEKPVPPDVPMDEPYEDSGELQEAPYVSPKKP
ncbi:MAG: FecR family protein [Planctomycetota bacterium]|nr:FecR family protein [Planctomycetota bacterium]